MARFPEECRAAASYRGAASCGGAALTLTLFMSATAETPYPIDQEKSALEFPYIQSDGFNLLVIINYQLSIIH